MSKFRDRFFLISTTSGSLQFVKIGVLKVGHFDPQSEPYTVAAYLRAAALMETQQIFSKGHRT